MTKSLALQIYEAFAVQDVAEVTRLVTAAPEQLTAHTMFGGATWLGHAADKGYAIIVKALLTLGADPNLSNGQGCTPLCDACQSGHAEIAAILLDAGTRLETAASIRNPLFAAVQSRSPDCVQLILEAGIDASVRYTSETMDDLDATAFALMIGAEDCAQAIARHLAHGDAAEAARLLAHADKVATHNAHRRPGRRRTPPA